MKKTKAKKTIYITMHAKPEMETLTNIFSHENPAAPPAFSHGDGLRAGTKSDLLQSFEVFGASQQQQKLTPKVDAILLDGAAVVQMLNPGTFQD